MEGESYDGIKYFQDQTGKDMRDHCSADSNLLGLKVGRLVVTESIRDFRSLAFHFRMKESGNQLLWRFSLWNFGEG